MIKPMATLRAVIGALAIQGRHMTEEWLITRGLGKFIEGEIRRRVRRLECERSRSVEVSYGYTLLERIYERAGDFRNAEIYLEGHARHPLTIEGSCGVFLAAAFRAADEGRPEFAARYLARAKASPLGESQNPNELESTFRAAENAIQRAEARKGAPRRKPPER